MYVADVKKWYFCFRLSDFFLELYNKMKADGGEGEKSEKRGDNKMSKGDSKLRENGIGKIVE